MVEREVDKVEPEDLLDDVDIHMEEAMEVLEEIGARKEFNEFARKKGISLENKEDWLPWWEFWCDGYHVAIRDVKGIL
jgi:hypothetical protein